MNFISNIIVLTWFLSVPFYSYSVTGTLSIDNVLSPVALLVLLFREMVSPLANKAIWKVRIQLLLIFTLYALSRLASGYGQPAVTEHTLILVAKQSLYLFIPTLYVRDLPSWRRASKFILGIGVIGISSTFLASIGFLEFENQRFAASRFGLEGFQKSVALLSNYGDMAILGSFSFLILFKLRGQPGYTKGRVLSWALMALIILGYLGAQSRNMYLTLLVAISFGWFLPRALGNAVALRALSIFFGILITATIVVGVYLAEVNPIQSARELGGTREAAGTVDVRLEQYRFAWDVFTSNPLFGRAATVMEQGVEVHNIWMGQLALGGVVGALAIALLLFLPLLRMLRLKPLESEPVTLRFVGITQSLCIIFAAEFYGGMTQIFLIMVAMMHLLPIVLDEASGESQTSHRGFIL